MGYKIINTKEVFRGKKISVISEKIQLPNGKIVEWEAIDNMNFIGAIPVSKKKEAIFTLEWRQGPECEILQITYGRTDDLDDLTSIKKELNEEVGIYGGKYRELITYASGTRKKGYKRLYIIEDFQIGRTNRDKDEIQKIIKIPINNIFKQIADNYITTSDILLAALLLQEKYK